MPRVLPTFKTEKSSAPPVIVRIQGAVMEYPFDALHAGIESQILNLPAGIPDSQAIRQAKSLPDSVEKFRALGKALSRQLRYREAVAAYTEGLNLEPENLSLLRLRAGRYLTTLQSDPAIADFEKCLTLGAEKLDCLYRIGLAQYYAGRYEQAMEALRAVCLYAMMKWGLRFFTGTR